MSIIRVSSRYAKSLLDLAIERKKLEAISADFKLINDVCIQNPDFELLLKSPIIPKSKKIVIVKAIFEGKVDELTMQYLELSCRKGREEMLPSMASSFVEQYNRKKNIRNATFITAVEVDEKMFGEVEKAVADMTGAKPKLTTEVEPDLVGGFILRLDDIQFDASVAGKLRGIKKELEIV